MGPGATSTGNVRFEGVLVIVGGTLVIGTLIVIGFEVWPLAVIV